MSDYLRSQVLDLDVIIDIDARPLPLGELPLCRGQGAEGVALYFLEQLSSADPELAHRPAVHCLHGARDGGVAFGEREEGLPPQAPQNVELRESHPGFDLGLVARVPSREWLELGWRSLRGGEPE